MRSQKVLFFLICFLLLTDLLLAENKSPVNTVLPVDTVLLPKESDWQTIGSKGAVCFDNDEMILDGRSNRTSAYYLPLEWSGDVTLRTTFLVEPSENGVLACGLMINVEDTATALYVHFDRTQAILCRSTPENLWIEIKRTGSLDKPAGKEHTAEFARKGNLLTVSLNGQKLYDAPIPKEVGSLGRVGFYAGEGKVHLKKMSAWGTPVPKAKPLSVPPKPFIYVCQDGGNGGYEAFPDVCRIADGRLLCVFYDGWTHVSVPNKQHKNSGRISGCYSSDEGKTWTPPFVLIDTPLDDRDPSLVQLKDGRILCNWFSYEQVPGHEALCTLLLAESKDGGKTWSQPRKIFDNVPCSSPIRVLSDGRLILPTYVQTDTEHSGSIAYSDDDGKTWSNNIIIPNGGMRLDAETDVLERKDGTLYAIQRDKMAWSISKDRGATWSESVNGGFPGHCPYLIRLKNDIIIVAYRLPNTSMRFSRDEGKTWSDNIQVDTVGGAYPSMVELKDGSVLIVYYEEGHGSSIRAKRFRINDDNKVEWLLF